MSSQADLSRTLDERLEAAAAERGVPKADIVKFAVDMLTSPGPVRQPAAIEAPHPIDFDVQISLINMPAEISLEEIDTIRALMDRARDAALAVLSEDADRPIPASLAATVALALKAHRHLEKTKTLLVDTRPAPGDALVLALAVEGFNTAMTTLHDRFEKEFPSG